MKIAFRTKTTWYDLRPGSVITDNQNETLDSASVFLDHQTTQLDLEPLDPVWLKNTFNTQKSYQDNSFLFPAGQLTISITLTLTEEVTTADEVIVKNQVSTEPTITVENFSVASVDRKKINVELSRETSTATDQHFVITLLYDKTNKEIPMCIDTYNEKIISFDPLIYNYEITLISLTKMLEGVILPNRSITAYMPSNYYPKATKDMIREFVELYSPRANCGTEDTIYGISQFAMNGRPVGATSTVDIISEGAITSYDTPTYIPRVQGGYISLGTPTLSADNKTLHIPTTLTQVSPIIDGAQGYIITKYTYSTNRPRLFYYENNQTYYGSCPEMEWEQPTLREVLTDLMMTQDCVPIVKPVENASGKYRFAITEKKLYETKPEITDYQKSKINYVERSKSLEDYASDIKITMQNVPVENETVDRFVGYRCEEQYILTDKNFDIITQNPIWELLEFKAVARYNSGQSALWVDLTSFVSEYGIWQTKPVVTGTGQTLNARNQNTSLYYNRGAKGIHGFTNGVDWQRFWQSGTDPVYQLIWNYLGTQVSGIYGEAEEVVYRIKYRTLHNVPAIIGKDSFQRNKKVIIDNQTTALVDAKRLVNLEQQKINRIGNKIVVANARYDIDDAIPDLAQTINGNIIFKRELAIFDDYIIANFYCTPNYVLKDYYTGIRSKLRSWRIEDATKIVERHELFKFYVNSTMPNYNPNDKNYVRGNFSSISELSSYLSGDILVGIYDEGFSPRNIESYSKVVTDNSVFITFSYRDNSTTGLAITSRTPLVESNIKYVNHDGEMVNLRVRMGNGLVKFPFDGGRDWSWYTSDREYYPDIAPDAIDETKISLQLYQPIYKDSRERLTITLQFELNENANDIIIGKV